MSWWKLALVALGLPVAAFMVFVAWVFVSFSGGLDDVLALDHPQPGDADVVAAEQRAGGDVEEVTDEVLGVLREEAPSAGEVASGTRQPECETGQHNFKIDDDFDLSCTLTSISVVAAPVADEGGVATQVDFALRGEGWVPVPRPPRSGGPTVSSAQDRPPYRYTREQDGQAWELVVDGADLSSLTYELRGYGSDELTDTSGRPVSLEEMVAFAPRDGYTVVVGVTVEYFRD